MFYTTNSNNHGLPFNPFKAIVAPRPIAWVSSLNEKGQANLAPYSFFNGMSDTPPIIGFSSGARKLGKNEPKDSVTNIENSGEFCVSIVSLALQDQMNLTSGHYNNGADEFEIADLEKGTSKTINAPFVAASPVAMECKLHGILDLPGGSRWVMGLVTAIHIKDEFIENGKLDITKYKPVARLGYKDYANITDTYALDRPE